MGVNQAESLHAVKKASWATNGRPLSAITCLQIIAIRRNEEVMVFNDYRSLKNEVEVQRRYSYEQRNEIYL